MGLNAVHMLSLSLPVVTHGDLSKHMGPEPEYIQHKENGWLLEKKNDVQSFEKALHKLWLTSQDDMKLMQSSSYKTYEKLSNPSLHERWLQMMGL